MVTLICLIRVEVSSFVTVAVVFDILMKHSYNT